MRGKLNHNFLISQRSLFAIRIEFQHGNRFQGILYSLSSKEFKTKLCVYGLSQGQRLY